MDIAQGHGKKPVSFFGSRKWLHIVLAILTGGGWLIVPLTIWLWRTGRRRGAAISGGVGALLVVIIAISSATSGSSTDSNTPPPAPGQPTANTPPPAPGQPTANIYLVASQSFCTATGVDDIYTGDGHVQFWFTLRNSGGESGSIDITPVRHYDDGTDNQSPLDTVTVEVAPGETWKGRTTAMTYKAHEHEVIGCGAIIGNGDEITIRDEHL